MKTAIGIDFGTTNSSIAVAREDGALKTALFQTPAGPTEAYRSVLYFEPKKPAVCGPLAIERYLASDEKGRLIQSLKSFLASKVFRSTTVYERTYSVEDLIAIILRDVRALAEAETGPFAGAIVVGRPVRYANAETEEDNNFALARLERALDQAGIGPVIFEHEPVAAAYFYESTLDHDELILIGDFGGGTSDFSLLRVGPESRRHGGQRILGTEGIALAGDAFDGCIVRRLISPKLGRGSEYRSLEKVLPMPEWIYSDLERWHYLSFLKSSDTVQMLRSIQANSFEPEKIASLLHIIQNDLGFDLHRAVQSMKTELSSEPVGSFVFDDYVVRMRGRVQRRSFESWIEEGLETVRQSVDRLLSKSGMKSPEVDRVFLTGGSSFVPAVRKIFEDRFGLERIVTGNEFTSVAKGLALRGVAEE